MRLDELGYYVILFVVLASQPTPLKRGHLADDVFSALATEILHGRMAPGSALPAERLLSDRFGVSKLLVRQAIHRLSDVGLVDVRQGGATRILDPKDVVDIRIFELYYRLAPESDATHDLARDVLEKQFTQGLSLVEIFERRASEDARVALVQIVDEARPHRGDEERFRLFEERFWQEVAEGGQNRILLAEVRWWYAALATRPELPTKRPASERWAFYDELARRLHDGDDAFAYYRRALSPGMKALFSAKRSTRTKTNTKKSR